VHRVTKKDLKGCACAFKASDYCAQYEQNDHSLVTTCHVTYVQICSAQCVNSSTKISQKTQRFAHKLCKKSTNPECTTKVVHHSEKAVAKVQTHLHKIHVLKKVGPTKQQVTKAIETNKVIASNNYKAKLVTKVAKEQENKKVVQQQIQKAVVVEVKKPVVEVKKPVQIAKKQEVVVKKQQTTEEKKHNQIKQEIGTHAKKCACTSAKTPQEKGKCKAECQFRHTQLKKKVHAHVSVSSCQAKASLACGDAATQECNDCKKSFLLICGEEESKKKEELVKLLSDCDSYLEDDFKTFVYQP